MVTKKPVRKAVKKPKAKKPASRKPKPTLHPTTWPPVWERLGLENPDTFAIKRICFNMSDRVVAERGVKRAHRMALRGTGRTYRMLFKAVELIEESVQRKRPPPRIALAGSTCATAQIHRRVLYAMIEQLGHRITPAMRADIRAYACDSVVMRGQFFDAVFEDHYTGVDYE